MPKMIIKGQRKEDNPSFRKTKCSCRSQVWKEWGGSEPQGTTVLLSYVADGDTQKEEEVSDVALHFLFDIHQTRCTIRILTAIGRSLEERAFSPWFLSGSSWLPWHLGSVKSPYSWVAALFPVSLPKPHAKLWMLLHSPKLLMGEVGRETFHHLEVDTSTVVVVDWFLSAQCIKCFSGEQRLSCFFCLSFINTDEYGLQNLGPPHLIPTWFLLLPAFTYIFSSLPRAISAPATLFPVPSSMNPQTVTHYSHQGLAIHDSGQTQVEGSHLQ